MMSRGPVLPGRDAALAEEANDRNDHADVERAGDERDETDERHDQPPDAADPHQPDRAKRGAEHDPAESTVPSGHKAANGQRRIHAGVRSGVGDHVRFLLPWRRCAMP